MSTFFVEEEEALRDRWKILEIGEQDGAYFWRIFVGTPWFSILGCNIWLNPCTQSGASSPKQRIGKETIQLKKGKPVSP